MTLYSDEDLQRLKDFTYHTVPESTSNLMAIVRGEYFALGLRLLKMLPDSRERSLALTALEESSMRAIQCLAVTYGQQILPTLPDEIGSTP